MRYLRLVGIETSAVAGLDLRGVRVVGESGSVATITISTTIAPSAGSLSNLTDGDGNTGATWSSSSVSYAGFALDIDCGADLATVGIAFQAGNASAWLSGATVLAKDGAGWVSLGYIGRIVNPGAGAWSDYAPLGIYSGNAALLLPGIDFIDRSPAERIMQVVGSGSVGVTSVGAKYSSALVFNGSTAYLSTPLVSLGTVDWCVESWLCLTGSNPYGHLLSLGTQSVFSVKYHTPSGWLYVVANGTSACVYDGFFPAIGVWNHVAASRSGNTLRIFVNGALVATATYAPSIAATPQTLYVGWGWSTEYMTANLEDARFVIGRPVYTAAFTPPGKLNPYAPRFVRALGGMRANVASSASLEPFAMRRTPGGLVARDAEFGGTAKIWGTTKIKGLLSNEPTKARVVLLHQRSKLVVRETWSHPTTGYFSFDGVDLAQQFITLAEDSAGSFRPVAANRLIPKVA